jgi:MFS family permease
VSGAGVEIGDGGHPPADGATTPRPRLWGRDFTLLLAVNVLLYTAFQMLTPTLPLYVLSLGGGTVAAGLTIGLFTGAAVLIRPFAGWALDAYGRRLLLLGGLAAFLLAAGTYGWVATVALLLVLRSLHGLGFGVFTVSSGTLAADLTPKSRLGEGMGLIGVTWSLSMATGPPLGLAIVHRLGFGPLFPVSAGIAAVALVLALFLRYPRLNHTRHPFSFAGMFDRAALFPAILALLLTTSYGLLIAFVTIYAAQQGVHNMGLFFAVYAVVLTGSRLFIGRASDRFGFWSVTLAGFALVTASLVTLSLAHTMVVFLLAGVFYGLGFGATQPSLLALVVVSLAESRRGAANAVFLNAWDIGITVGSVGGGILAAYLSFSRLYLLAVIPQVVAIALLVARWRAADRRLPSGRAAF